MDETGEVEAGGAQLGFVLHPPSFVLSAARLTFLVSWRLNVGVGNEGAKESLSNHSDSVIPKPQRKRHRGSSSEDTVV
jgi:hypothetical protein